MINFQIATPERVVYKEKVDKITLPTEQGEITILPGHIPLVANLKSGELQVYRGDEIIPYAVTGGFVEVRTARDVIVLADAAEHVEEIDVKRAEDARSRAKKLMEGKNRDDVLFVAGAAGLERSLTRLRLARKRKYRKAPPEVKPGL